MQLSQFSVRVGSVSSHHEIRNNLYIMLLQYQDIGAIQANRVFNLNKHTGSLILIQEIMPSGKFYDRGRDIYLSVHQGIQCGCRGTHTDIRNLADGILLYISKKHCVVFLCFQRIRSPLCICIASNCLRFIVVGQIYSGEQCIYFILRQPTVHPYSSSLITDVILTA